MRCHYEVLGIEMNATIDDIKKAYRKMALQWHPDKHSENKEEANKRFLEIQDAYETLSNDQERAWYDSHREVIINGGKPGESDKDNFLFNIYPYFSSTCFRGYGDDDKSFYTIYREMFVKIAEEDRPYYEEKLDIPEFGKSDSDYETVVGPFYTFWLSYCCPRSFVWVEQHDVRDANDRYVRRAMEKENKKARDKAKKERNEEIRKIVDYVRKRDKRVDEYKKILEERAQLAQQKVKEKKEAERLKRVEQLKNLDYDWSAIDQHLEELELEEKRKLKKKENTKQEEENEEPEEENVDDADGQDELESDYDESLYCVACDKSFQSAKSFQNHEKSKKHRENVELLRKHMIEEEAELKGQDESLKIEDSDNDQTVETQKTKLSKKQKKKRRQNRIEMNEDSDDNLESQEVEVEKKSDEEPQSKQSAKSKKKEKKINKKEIEQPKIEEEQQEKVEKKPICSVCNEEFETRNKLFEHIKKEGHAVLKTADDNQPLSHNAIKKSKRLAKAKK